MRKVLYILPFIKIYKFYKIVEKKNNNDKKANNSKTKQKEVEEMIDTLLNV